MRRAMRTKGARFLIVPVAVLIWAVIPAAKAATVEVHISGSQFAPTSVVINANDTVVFVNDDSYAHDVAFQAGFSTGGPGSLGAGQRWNHTFEANGTFLFRCAMHSGSYEHGMVGKVTVGPSGPEPRRSPGFEFVGVVAAIGLVAAIRLRGSRP